MMFEGAIVRCINNSVNWDEFTELQIIGIDEIAMRKGHGNFVAIITTQQSDGHVALLGCWQTAKRKRCGSSWRAFPNASIQRWQGCVQTCGRAIPTLSVAEFAAAHPEVSLEVVIDRFHVAENYREGADLLRKQECRRLKEELSAEEYAEIQGVL